MMHLLEKIDRREVVQDEWIPTTCSMCLHHCGILVHVVNGVAIKVEGDPDNPDNAGHNCARAPAVLMRQYDPFRVKRPMIRTNPEKGIGVDPKWREISWDEAWEIIVPKLKKILEEDPRKLLFAATDFRRPWIWAWGGAVFGTPNGFYSDLGTTCGGGYHPVNGILFGSFATQPDWKYVKYLVSVGGGDGFESHLHLTCNIRRASDARMRGLKVVVVDPRMSNAAVKADEWIPIRPGTSLAFALGMINSMLWEIRGYDEWFLKNRTNAPYLIGPDGYYVRDKETKKPLVWDPVDNRAKPFNDKTVKDFALEGVYKVDGVEARPAFQVIKDSLKTYTPEWASQITTVPAETIRRIAREFVANAHIGETIEINGKKYPYRPVCFQWYRGAHAHEHSWLANLAFKYVNMLVGAVDTPGGQINVPLGWDPHIDAWAEKRYGWKGPAYNFVVPNEDGIVTPWIYELRPPVPMEYPPKHLDLLEYFPVGLEAGHLYTDAVLNPDYFGIDYRPEAALFIHANPVWNIPASLRTIEALKKLDLVISVDLISTSETTMMADIVLPDTSPLESWALLHCEAPFVTGYTLRRPVVKPPPEAMDATDFLTELSARLGILHKWNGFLNWRYIEPFGKPQYYLEPNKKYTVPEFLDRWMKAQYGEEMGLDWFIKNKNNIREMSPEELYWPYGDVRVQLYVETVKKFGDELESFFKRIGYPKPWMKGWTRDYLPYPAWRDLRIHNPDDKSYDLYMIYYKLPHMTFADQATVPWTSDIVQSKPDLVSALINSETAARKGLRTGDEVVIESKAGSVRAVVYVTEAVHPDVVALSNAGRWVNHPWAINYAPSSSILVESGLDLTDKVSGCPETAARVRIRKVE
ncbi:Polysulfide reductase chain A [archaeon HR01]|nr:Polysulfide reductase chain A [archaeon HR01]